jgi:membrane associated rhomboid family serine protease
MRGTMNRYRSYQGFSLNTIWVLIIVNLLLFIVTLIVPNLILLLGLQPAGLLSRPWTIVTSMFVHGGFWHVFANMLTLYFFGSAVFRLVGQGRFLAVYFGGGILGSILFILLASPFTIAVGASGAIFALGGVLTVMRPKIKVFIFPIPAPIPLWVAVIGGFVILSFMPFIAWQGHLGGLIVGLVAGYFFRRRERYAFY